MSFEDKNKRNVAIALLCVLIPLMALGSGIYLIHAAPPGNTTYEYTVEAASIGSSVDGSTNLSELSPTEQKIITRAYANESGQHKTGEYTRPVMDEGTRTINVADDETLLVHVSEREVENQSEQQGFGSILFILGCMTLFFGSLEGLDIYSDA